MPAPLWRISFSNRRICWSLLSLDGLRHWVDYGIRNYGHHPEQQRDYFTLQSADSRAVLARERHGTLLVDHNRQLDLFLRGLWQDSALLIPTRPVLTICVNPFPTLTPWACACPMFMTTGTASRAWTVTALRWPTWRRTGAGAVPSWPTTSARFNVWQLNLWRTHGWRLLAMRIYPGLRRIFLALHTKPLEGACDPTTHSCLRHRLAMLSRALLDPAHGYQDALLQHFVQRFQDAMAQGESSTQDMAKLALSYVAQTRVQSDQLAKTFFEDTEVSYRDDNRHLWTYHEYSDDEEMFESPRQATLTEDATRLPPRHYPEWDYTSQSYRPDWVSLYERLHPSGHAAEIDALLLKHSALAKRLKRMLDLLKPQDRKRVRYQEEGSELDLDIAIRAVVDLQSGSTPDPRIHQSHQTDGRSIAVLLLLDLSESLNQKTTDTEQSILELSQEAVSLLAWSIEQLGDAFAIAGFHSNTRHDVRYLHIKGFGEHWGIDVKARLAAMQAGYSTRMGAALRHGAHYLGAQQADKKLMLVLTDGQPSDVDAPDERLLIEDARQSVKELDQQGIFSYCINLDPKADAYVSRIFGQQYTVIDHVARLPEKLPSLFMSLTR
jgi:nitric oxide reductase NorD protein